MNFMNAGFAHTTESLFGPASEVIDISEFLRTATNAIDIVQAADSPTIPVDIAEECRWLPPTAILGDSLLTFNSVSKKSVVL